MHRAQPLRRAFRAVPPMRVDALKLSSQSGVTIRTMTTIRPHGGLDIEPTLEVIVDALHAAAEEREARLDGSCADRTGTDTGLCGDHAADLEAAMRFRDAIDEIDHGTDVEHYADLGIMPTCRELLVAVA